MSALPVTPSQTVGPFFHDCMLRHDTRHDTIPAGDDTDRIHVHGRVLDGDGVGVPDAVIEVWHADGFARVGTDEQGQFSFVTPRPRAVPFDLVTMQAPHLSAAVFARGLLNHLFTRVYFADEPATASDPILARVPRERRATLLATHDSAGSLTPTYRFDVVLQGEDETVFFDFGATAR